MAIEAFYIDLDLSEVRLLYDYDHEDIIAPKNGKWVVGELKKLFLHAETGDSRAKTNPAHKSNVHILDSSFYAKGCQELDNEHHTGGRRRSLNCLDTVHPPGGRRHSLNCLDTVHHTGGRRRPSRLRRISESEVSYQTQSEAEVPNRLLPVVRPGSVVKGDVVIELKESCDFERVLVSLRGGERVHTQQLIETHFDRGDWKKHVDETYVLWGEARLGESMRDVNDQSSLITSTPPLDRKTGPLPPGKHRFPFQFVVPEDAAGSMLPVICCEKEYAYHICYRLKATIDKGKLLKFGNLAVGRGLWINKEYDIASIPEDLTPHTVKETMATGVLKSGLVTCIATLEQRAFVRGDVINVNLQIINDDSSLISEVRARLKFGHSMRIGGTGFRSYEEFFKLKSHKVFGDPVPAHSDVTQTLRLPMDFLKMDSRVIPVGSQEKCKLLKAQYKLVIKLKRKGAHMAMELKIPVRIGTQNSATSHYDALG